MHVSIPIYSHLIFEISMVLINSSNLTSCEIVKMECEYGLLGGYEVIYG